MNVLTKLIAFFIVSLFFASCQKNDDLPETKEALISNAKYDVTSGNEIIRLVNQKYGTSYRFPSQQIKEVAIEQEQEPPVTGLPGYFHSMTEYPDGRIEIRCYPLDAVCAIIITAPSGGNSNNQIESTQYGHTSVKDLIVATPASPTLYKNVSIGNVVSNPSGSSIEFSNEAL